MPRKSDITKSLQTLLKKHSIEEMIKGNEDMKSTSQLEIKIYGLVSCRGGEGKLPVRINEDTIEASFANLQEYLHFVSEENYLNVCINNKYYDLKEACTKIQENLENFLVDVEENYMFYCV